MSGRLGRLVLSLRRNLGAGTSLERLCKRCAPLAGRLGAGLDLLAAGCVEWQGHHYSPALEAAAFERLARGERAAAAG